LQPLKANGRAPFPSYDTCGMLHLSVPHVLIYTCSPAVNESPQRCKRPFCLQNGSVQRCKRPFCPPNDHFIIHLIS